MEEAETGKTSIPVATSDIISNRNQSGMRDYNERLVLSLVRPAGNSLRQRSPG